MTSIDEQILKTAKEVVVKFIECGRTSPTSFAETFQIVYHAVNDTVKSHQQLTKKDPESAPQK